MGPLDLINCAWSTSYFASASAAALHLQPRHLHSQPPNEPTLQMPPSHRPVEYGHWQLSVQAALSAQYAIHFPLPQAGVAAGHTQLSAAAQVPPTSQIFCVSAAVGQYQSGLALQEQ